MAKVTLFFYYVCKMKITIIRYQSSEYHEMLALRSQILREPWGLHLSEEDILSEKDDAFIACRENDSLIGCCILTVYSPTIMKLRQMAVSGQWQGKNVGTKILAFAEQYAAENGYSIIRLHARKTALRFYEKCGYTAKGDEFIEIGIPHVLMEKNVIIVNS